MFSTGPFDSPNVEIHTYSDIISITMSLERLQPHLVEREDTPLRSKKGDAFALIEPYEGSVEVFVPLEEGNYRDPRLIENTGELFLPPGSVAALLIADQEVLVKHLKKRGDHKHGLLFVGVGGEIFGPDKNRHYRMRQGKTQFLARREFDAEFAGLHIVGYFVE